MGIRHPQGLWGERRDGVFLWHLPIYCLATLLVLYRLTTRRIVSSRTGAMKSLLLTVLVLLLGACASLDDFQKMSPDERARKVCESSSSYRQRATSLRQLNDQIAEKEYVLARGFRVYEQCQVMPITVPGKTVDCSNQTGESLENCQKQNTQPTTVWRNVCTQVPVPIDYRYESSAVGDLQMSRESLLEQHEQSTYTCEARVRSLSAERAYLLYKQDTEY